MKVTVKNKAGNQKCWRALCGFRFCFLSFFFFFGVIIFLV